MNIKKWTYNFQTSKFYSTRSMTPFQCKCQIRLKANFVYWFYCKRNTCILAGTLDDFLRQLFEQYRIENCGKQICVLHMRGNWQVFILQYFLFLLYFVLSLTDLFIYLLFYFVLCINVVNLLSVKKITIKFTRAGRLSKPPGYLKDYAWLHLMFVHNYVGDS